MLFTDHGRDKGAVYSSNAYVSVSAVQSFLSVAW